MFYGIEDIINKLDDREAQRLNVHLANLENTVHMLTDERNYLRGQITVALRSMKFDLHPEI